MSIPDHARANFQTLLRAAADRNLALMECRDAATGGAALRHLRSRSRRNGFRVHTLRPSRRRQSLRRLSAAVPTPGRPIGLLTAAPRPV